MDLAALTWEVYGAYNENVYKVLKGWWDNNKLEMFLYILTPQINVAFSYWFITSDDLC